MNCLNANLIKKIANEVPIEDLVNLRDRKDKLTSKIYMKKLEDLIQEESVASNYSTNQPNINTAQDKKEKTQLISYNSQLYRCVYCGYLFTSEQREWMVCPNAKIFIDFHGTVIAQHVADRYWDINRFIQFMKKESISWKEIYWKIWGRLQTFECQVCNQKFIGSDLAHCSYHPQNPKFQYSSNIGFFPCCNQKALRFDTSIKRQGCKASNHIIHQKQKIQDEQQNKLFELLLKHQDIICEPFDLQLQSKQQQQQHEDDIATIASKDKHQEENKNNTDKKQEGQSTSDNTSIHLSKLLTKYNENNKKHSQNQQRILFEFEEEEEDDDQEFDMVDNDIANVTAQTNITNTNNVGGALGQNQLKQYSRALSQQPYNSNFMIGNRKMQKSFRRDVLRQDDMCNMKDLMSKMNKYRMDDKQIFKNHKSGKNENNNKEEGSQQRDSSPSKNNGGSVPRPLSEPGGINKKSINYRIKNKVIKK